MYPYSPICEDDWVLNMNISSNSVTKRVVLLQVDAVVFLVLFCFSSAILSPALLVIWTVFCVLKSDQYVMNLLMFTKMKKPWRLVNKACGLVEESYSDSFIYVKVSFSRLMTC